jgi:sporulation protein YlmC with PRC-barrel domain
MTMRRPFHLFVAAFAFAAFAGSWRVASADDVKENKDQAKVSVSHVFRSSEIIGLAVYNKAGENLGKIDDLVVDMKNGDIRYVALSHGGVAGIGSKLFAVPWEKMTFMFGEPNKANSRHFMFDASKEQLDKAPGFETSHWPNVADPQWSASIDKHYNVERKEHAQDQVAAPKVAYETVFRASKIKGMDVRNDANENLGDVDELVIDVTMGHVKYVALSFGSWFTGGNKLFAVPLSAFTLKHDNDKTFLVTHVSQESLRNAPGFDKNHWPDTANPDWAKGIDTYYERTAQRNRTIQK